jgi:hypothetical protein
LKRGKESYGRAKKLVIGNPLEKEWGSRELNFALAASEKHRKRM